MLVAADLQLLLTSLYTKDFGSPELVQESLQILLHLDGVVVDLGHAEDPQLAILPGAVLLQQEREEHQQAAVVHDPPDVDGTLHL